MISFKQYLTEAFDNPYPYKKLSKNKFKFQDITVEIETEINQYKKTKDYDFYFYTGDRDYSLSKTKSMGEAMRTYATIIKIMTEFIQSVNLKSGDSIEFTSADNRTIPIYKKFAAHLIKEFQLESVPLGSEGIFKLRKK